jgi:hypothetical protein
MFELVTTKVAEAKSFSGLPVTVTTYVPGVAVLRTVN